MSANNSKKSVDTNNILDKIFSTFVEQQLDAGREKAILLQLMFANFSSQLQELIKLSENKNSQSSLENENNNNEDNDINDDNLSQSSSSISSSSSANMDESKINKENNKSTIITTENLFEILQTFENNVRKNLQNILEQFLKLVLRKVGSSLISRNIDARKLSAIIIQVNSIFLLHYSSVFTLNHNFY